jgi:hypothetical protein
VKRLFRYTFTLLSAISLLLCMAVCALWVRSYWVCDMVGYESAYSATSAYSLNGQMFCQRLVTIPFEIPLSGWAYSHDDASNFNPSFPAEASVLGFAHTEQSRRFLDSSWRETWTVVPHYAIAALCAVLPAWSTLRWWCHRNRRATGRCAVCGYDLRATPDRCPECGTAPTARR